MRVVSGEAKGRRLKSPKTTGTRPIIDRVKTALFDILSVRVEDTNFLDLFAGTGSVGIEALSRGAARATFIELNATVLKLVRENLRITGLSDRAETLHADAFKFLHTARADTSAMGTINRPLRENGRQGRDVGRRGWGERRYNIVYVAPPQYKGLAARALGLLDGSPLVAENGLVIVQIHPKERAEVAGVELRHLALSDERRYGSTLLMFYEPVREKLSDVDTITEA